MEKETTINGFKCKFIDNDENPKYNFFCVPILHDSKYCKVWATIKNGTANQQVHFIGSYAIFPGKLLSIFVFTYSTKDDIEFITRNAQLVFSEMHEKEENENKEDKEPYILIKDGNRMEIIALLNKRLGIKLSALKDSVTKNAFNDVQIYPNEEMPDIKSVYNFLDWENYNPKIYYTK